MTSHLVAAIVYDGLCTFEYGIAVEIFGHRRLGAEIPWYDFVPCAAEAGPLHGAGRLLVDKVQGLKTLSKADTIVIPGWRGPDHRPPDKLLRALAYAHAQGTRIVSICSGVFVLAAAGILNNRRATTHWAYIQALKAAYPSIEVIDDVLYVDDGNILTSAGSAAGLDLCLHIVRQDFGPKIANAIAQRLVLPAHREGGQAQFVPRPVNKERGNLAPLMDKIRRSLDRKHTLSKMASSANMTKRTFLRRFQEATGLTPQAWLIQERVAHARYLLETASTNIEEIAYRCGFGSAETFRYHFRHLMKVSPIAYRRAFGHRERRVR